MKKALNFYFLLRLFAGPQFALEIIRTGRRGIFSGAIMLPWPIMLVSTEEHRGKTALN